MREQIIAIAKELVKTRDVEWDIRDNTIRIYLMDADKLDVWDEPRSYINYQLVKKLEDLLTSCERHEYNDFYFEDCKVHRGYASLEF